MTLVLRALSRVDSARGVRDSSDVRLAGPLVLFALSACSSEPASERARRVVIDRADLPLLGASDAERARFEEGDALFEAAFREADGRGPLFIRDACAACHRDDARGPGVVGRLAAADIALPFGSTERPYATAGAKRALLAHELDPGLRVTYRLPPAVFGRGYLEAVPDVEIERLARTAAERAGPIRGRIHRVGTGIGRFGHKARSPSLLEFTADALQGDMGLTSPERPSELPNPDGIEDDDKPGIDVSSEVVRALADYVRLLEIPPRATPSARAERLFAEAQCALCHTPTLRTGSSPVAALANRDIALYTDFLLHDMGDGLADDVPEGEASGREWRSAPLLGLRFLSSFLHDGRARTVEQAVLAHAGAGSEANDSVARFRALSPADRRELLRFVEGL